MVVTERKRAYQLTEKDLPTKMNSLFGYECPRSPLLKCISVFLQLCGVSASACSSPFLSLFPSLAAAAGAALTDRINLPFSSSSSRKNMYRTAISLANSQDCDEAYIADIFQKYVCLSFVSPHPPYLSLSLPLSLSIFLSLLRVFLCSLSLLIVDDEDVGLAVVVWCMDVDIGVRRYGDHLYAKKDYDGAIQQYLETVGHVEPSYVIRKVSELANEE